MATLILASSSGIENGLNVGSQLSLIGHQPSDFPTQPLKHTVVVPISGLHKGVVEALKYARSISTDIRALYVEIDEPTTKRLQEEWKRWGEGCTLVVLQSPYRSVVGPLIECIDQIRDEKQGKIVTVLVPEFVTSKWWTGVLHNQTAIFIRALLAFRRGVVTTSVRYHLN